MIYNQKFNKIVQNPQFINKLAGAVLVNLIQDILIIFSFDGIDMEIHSDFEPEQSQLMLLPDESKKNLNLKKIFERKNLD